MNIVFGSLLFLADNDSALSTEIPTTSVANEFEQKEHEKALKTSEIVAAVFGSLLLVLIICWAVFYVKRQKLFRILSLIPKRKVENTDQEQLFEENDFKCVKCNKKFLINQEISLLPCR